MRAEGGRDLADHGYDLVGTKDLGGEKGFCYCLTERRRLRLQHGSTQQAPR
jgi:hypothetical protein